MNTTKAHCNGCLGERNHEVLHAHDTGWHDEENGVSGSNRYELLKCCGCDRISLRHTSWFSEDYDEEGRPFPTIRYFPPSISRSRPTWYNQLQEIEGINFLIQLLKEIYIGLQNGTSCMATMGIRALLEYIMIMKVGDHGSFSKNISEFQAKGYISESQLKILSVVLEAGHAAMHRSFSSSPEDLATCMDIAESLIETIYIHPLKADELSKKIPKKENKGRT